MAVILPDRALTLWQPWAWLVASGIKPIENRPAGFSHKSFRGDFWIHAATESTKQIASFLDADRLCREILGDTFRIPDATTLAYGAIIGRATITGIMPPRTTPPHLAIWDAGVFLEKLRPWHFPDQYGFKVENARPLAVPVPCRGYQGFWRVPEPVLEKLRRGRVTELDDLRSTVRSMRIQRTRSLGLRMLNDAIVHAALAFLFYDRFFPVCLGFGVSCAVGVVGGILELNDAACDRPSDGLGGT